MPNDPKSIAERGAQIYESRYRANFERDHVGKFVAIDVRTEEAFVAATPEEAIKTAQTKNPQGMFHLIKIGSSGVFRVSYSVAGERRGNWIFGG